MAYRISRCKASWRRFSSQMRESYYDVYSLCACGMYWDFNLAISQDERRKIAEHLNQNSENWIVFINSKLAWKLCWICRSKYRCILNTNDRFYQSSSPIPASLWTNSPAIDVNFAIPLEKQLIFNRKIPFIKWVNPHAPVPHTHPSIHAIHCCQYTPSVRN